MKVRRIFGIAPIRENLSVNSGQRFGTRHRMLGLMGCVGLARRSGGPHGSIRRGVGEFEHRHIHQRRGWKFGSYRDVPGVWAMANEVEL